MINQLQSRSHVSVPDWKTHEINLGGVTYPYYFGYDCLPQLADMIIGFDADLILLVTDDTVLDLHGADLIELLAAHVPVEVLSTPAGEGIKTNQVLVSHLEQAIAVGASRRSVVVAFGGGVPGNLAGLMAALLYRGVRLIHIPTTIMAATDSTISFKQTINSTKGKNHIGTYYVPECVITDVKLMQTLPDREVRSGFSEAIKNSLSICPEDISDLRALLSSGNLTSSDALLWLIDTAIQAKVAVTVNDSREQKTGLILEYGHTVGHAIEMCDYRLKGANGLSHGESVALGMLSAAYLSSKMCGLPEEILRLHHEFIVELLGVPARLPQCITTDHVMRQVLKDNKRGYLNVAQNEAAMVLLYNLGEPATTGTLPLVAVPLDYVQQSIEYLVPATK